MKNYFLLILLLSFVSSYAQTELVLERVEGLTSNDRIEDIEVADGQVWIASKDGIFNYDNNSNSLSQITDHDNALAIKVSSKGDIFSAFNDRTLYYNEDNIIDISSNFRKYMDGDFEFKDIEVYNKELWVASNHGIFIFDLKSKKLKEHYTTRNSSLKSDQVNFVIYSQNNESLWVGTDDGAYEIKNRYKKWKSEYKGHKMIAATENPEGLWLLSDLELYLMIKGREHPQGLKKGLYEGEVNDLTLDHNNNLYVASDILTRFDPYQDRLEKYGENLGLAASKCTSLACDSKGALWLGTSDAGLFRIYADEVDLQEMRISILVEQPISCPGAKDGSISIAVSGGAPPFKYFWERARLKGEHKPSQLGAGTYEVTVEDANGARTNSSIRVSDPKEIAFVINDTRNATSVTRPDGYAFIRPIGGTPPYNIRWESKEQGLEARKLSVGNNGVTITDSNGCESSGIIEIKKPKIMPELDIAKIKVGQTLQLNKLYFDADSSSITTKSYDVLEEVYDFLNSNSNVYIEIGGHTNNKPSHDYCDQLSSSRAANVAKFLHVKGIKEERISYMGYGKRKPIASNDTSDGRRKNQRVEIKILRVES